MTTLTRVVLARSEWSERMREHGERADALTAARRHRAARGETHPVDDFLYTYYSYKPAVLRRWHPGRDVVLDDAADAPQSGWRWYRTDGDAVTADAEAFLAEKAPLVRAISGILASTLGRAGSYGCFGMHEWAMVYQDRETRHPVPLRLGASGTDAVVEAHDLRCTHIDAFRFFTPDAVPRNRFAPTRDTQAQTEQPGCLHAGMDLYKWAVKLGPLVPGEVLLDAFELARDIRELDMRASPYDLRDWGYAPVAVETPAGKAEYVAAQRGFTERSQPIRARLLALIR
ncbi:3-methyladenine DNA glycosylase [Microbacterium sp. MM2322]|uniref:3-methyladenine DNA glycosylase n=1 Tax=Microbacterium sp. MM2322 TaxID=3157631 RepID=UPI0032D5A56E